MASKSKTTQNELTSIRTSNDQILAEKRESDALNSKNYRKRQKLLKITQPSENSSEKNEAASGLNEMQINDDTEYDNECVEDNPESEEECEQGVIYGDRGIRFEFFRDEVIYEGCDITIKDFAISYLCVANKHHLSIEARNEMLQFIKSLLPPINNIPLTFNSLISPITIERAIEKKICAHCHNEVQQSKCVNRKCDSNKPMAKATQAVESLFMFDVERQTREVLVREWEHFISYKSLKT
jgi:hypothetical protein